LLPLGSALWVLKVGLVALMGVFVALVWKCARQLGYDGRFAVLFVALNPIILIWDVGGFHNDPVMLVPMMAAISLVIGRRYRWAGAALAVAVAVKVTIVLLLPFLMVAAYRHRRSLQVVVGFVLGAIPLAAVSIAAFGLSMPNVADQSRIVTPLSVVNLAGVVLHLGGASPLMENGSKVLLVVAVGALLLMSVRRGRPDWLTGAGWATLGLLACTSWLMPWYIVWALPLVALSTSRWLRRTTLVFSVFAAFTFLPVTTNVLYYLHLQLMKSTPDRIATYYLRSVQH
jgi:alpha-1,6-mannosyltransferase